MNKLGKILGVSLLGLVAAGCTTRVDNHGDQKKYNKYSEEEGQKYWLSKWEAKNTQNEEKAKESLRFLFDEDHDYKLSDKEALKAFDDLSTSSQHSHFESPPSSLSLKILSHALAQQRSLTLEELQLLDSTGYSLYSDEGNYGLGSCNSRNWFRAFAGLRKENIEKSPVDRSKNLWKSKFDKDRDGRLSDEETLKALNYLLSHDELLYHSVITALTDFRKESLDKTKKRL